MSILPILRFEDKILETVEKHSVVVVIGETGSGKSTQLSQILHRRGYTRTGAIAVTQPRRVAAVSVSSAKAANEARTEDKHKSHSYIIRNYTVTTASLSSSIIELHTTSISRSIIWELTTRNQGSSNNAQAIILF